MQGVTIKDFDTSVILPCRGAFKFGGILLMECSIPEATQEISSWREIRLPGCIH